MRPVAFGNIVLHMESPEASRYRAPILIVPGLFQSPICWRGLTSILAHRGWEVYLLPRVPSEALQGKKPGEDKSWNEAVDDLVTAAKHLGDNVILFGSDVGAAMALSAVDRIDPMALALFAPTEPAVAGKTFHGSLGMWEKRRFKKTKGPLIAPPAKHAADAYQPTDVACEPETFLREAFAGASFARPQAHPPAIVFGSRNDPVVDNDHALSFADGRIAKAGKSTLVGRWWPSIGWEAASEQAHRFLILTLSDRVVEFPDEILED